MMRLNKLYAAVLGGMLFLMSCDRTEDISFSDNEENFTLECAKSAWSHKKVVR